MSEGFKLFMVQHTVLDMQMEDEGAAGEGSLQGSVSFGGSVAQKKAYFEAHYKNVAARKAEQEDRDKKKGTQTRDPPVDDQTQRDLSGVNIAVEPGLNVDESEGQNCAKAFELESQVQNSGCEISGSEIVELKNFADPLPITEYVKDESCFRPGTPELCTSEESVVVKEEAPHLGSEEAEELPQKISGTRASDKKEETDKVKSEKCLKLQKATSAKRGLSTSVGKKTPTSSTTKSSVMSTPKLSRPTLSKSITPTPKAMSKKKNSASPLPSKQLTAVESRRIAPTSLHMSLNLDPTNSERAMGTTMRKSLIMERMGDKDIVKRAFKAFSSNFNQLSSSGSANLSAESVIPNKTTDTKTSSMGTPSKKTEGGNRLVKKLSPRSSQTGLGKTSNASRVPNTVSAAPRNNKLISSTSGPKSHDKAEQGKKSSKKLEVKVNDKVNGKAFETTQLQSTEKKKAEMKRLQHSCTTKNKAISGTFASKSPSLKLCFVILPSKTRFYIVLIPKS